MGSIRHTSVQKALSPPPLGGSLHACTGRALEWHSRGQRFDPAYLHQKEGHDASRVLLFGFRRPEGGGNLGGRRPQPSGRSPEPPFSAGGCRQALWIWGFAPRATYFSHGRKVGKSPLRGTNPSDKGRPPGFDPLRTPGLRGRKTGASLY